MHKEDELTINVVKKVSPAVVSIIASKFMPDIKKIAPGSNSGGPFGFIIPNRLDAPSHHIIEKRRGEKIRVGGGSGFIVDPSGIILTNKHVVFDTNAEYTVITSNEKEYEAKVLVRDPVDDVAILKINSRSNNFPSVRLGNSKSIEPGQTVLAIGNALGMFSNTISKGIISGLARKISASMKDGEEEKVEQLKGVIQTDVAINQGNSGGPLINLDGEVIGINTAVIFGAQNIGFAIPVEWAKRDIEDFKKYGRAIKPFIGIRYAMLSPEIKNAYNLPVDYGALVIQDHLPGKDAVIPHSPAEKAGLKENDIILKVNNKKLNEKNELLDVIQNYKVGDELELEIMRSSKKFNTKLKLEERK